MADIRRIVGATDPSKADHGTIRGDLGDDSFDRCASENRSCYNLIHASDSFENAKEEQSLSRKDTACINRAKALVRMYRKGK